MQQEPQLLAGYTDAFTSLVQARNIFGVQLAPEKCHHNGLQLLKIVAKL